MANGKKKANGGAGRHPVLKAVAVILAAVIIALALAFCLGAFDPLMNTTYKFEAEKGKLTGGATVVKDEDLTYVGTMNEGATVTFELESNKDATAELEVRLTAAAVDKNLTDLVGIDVNGVTYKTRYTVVKGDTKNGWQTVDAGAIVLNKGKNTLVLRGTGLSNQDWVKLTVQKGVKLALIEGQASEAVNGIGGMEVEGDDGDSAVKLSFRTLSRAEYADYAVPASAESSQVITATITPSYAAVKTLDWSIAWKNESSEWATGKTVTDYVTLTPTTEGANTATVACLQAFGEQIIITVKPRVAASPDVKATCTVDYSQRFIRPAASVASGSMSSGRIFSVSTSLRYDSTTGSIYLPPDLTAPAIEAAYYSISVGGTYTIPLTGNITLKTYFRSKLENADDPQNSSKALGYKLQHKTEWTEYNSLTVDISSFSLDSHQVLTHDMTIPAGEKYISKLLATIYPDVVSGTNYSTFTEKYAGLLYCISSKNAHPTAKEFMEMKCTAEIGGKTYESTISYSPYEVPSVSITNLEIDVPGIVF